MTPAQILGLPVSTASGRCAPAHTRRVDLDSSFDHQVASAGVVFSEQQHPSLKSKQPEIIWQEAELAGNAASSWSQAQPLYPLKKLERVSFIHQRVHGSRWIMLPSAAGFVDPLLSDSFPMTLGIQRIAQGCPKQKLWSRRAPILMGAGSQVEPTGNAPGG